MALAAKEMQFAERTVTISKGLEGNCNCSRLTRLKIEGRRPDGAQNVFGADDLHRIDFLD